MKNLPRKPNSGTTLVIQEHIPKISETVSSFASSRQVGITIGQVMEHVAACGARYDTNEHFVATELFVKKDQREMFMTIPANEARFNWLRRKYDGSRVDRQPIRCFWQSRSAPAAYARSQVARLSDYACGLAEPAPGPPLPIPHRGSKINPPPLTARLPSPAAYSRAAT